MSASAEDLVKEVPNPPQDLLDSDRRDLGTGRRWVDWILVGVDRLNSQFVVDANAYALVRELVLQKSFIACLYLWNGRTEIGKASLVDAWIDSLSLVGLNDERFRSLRNLWIHQAPRLKFDLSWHDFEFLAVFNTAVGERLIAEGTLWQGRQVVRDLIVRLGMTPEEVAETLGVSTETLTDWEGARKTIPLEKLGQLQAASRALSKLLSLFRPERLPQVIRRPAELFNHRTAVDWIIDGRIGDVAERYESVLAYQG